MEQHTPGPWYASPDAVPQGFVQITVSAEDDGERVATVFQTEANARLIAAAPDLFAAAQTVIVAFGKNPRTPVYRKLEEAIFTETE